MIIHRVGMAAWVLAASGFAAGTTLQAQPPSADPAPAVANLTSDQHRARDQAFAALVTAGVTSVPALTQAAISKDPELSWRATEALQMLCQTVDLRGAAAVRSALAKASRSTNKDEAQVAKKVLQQWPIYRHEYAATQLELLGAEVADYPPEQMLQPQGGFPGGGVFFGAVRPLMAADFDEDVIIEEPVAKRPPARLPEDAIPILGGLFRIMKRAVADVEEVEEAADAEMEGAADADVIVVDGVAIGGGPLEIEAWDADHHAAAEFVSADGSENEALQPGTLRIGKEWRGGNGGLEYAAGLQQLHTVILREAPLTDEALAQIARLPSLSQLRLINTRLSSAALLKFRQARPQVNITAIGPAVLGLTGSDHPQGLLVQSVTPETGARRAGLDEQDVITRVGGLKVRSLNDVVLALYDKHPGGKVKVDYLRQGKPQSVEVTLTRREDLPAAAVAPDSVQQFLSQPRMEFMGPGMERLMILEEEEEKLGIDLAE